MVMDRQIIATWISDVPIGADPNGPISTRPRNLRQSTTAPIRYDPSFPSGNPTSTTSDDNNPPDTPPQRKRKRKEFEITHITDSRSPQRIDYPQQTHYQVQWKDCGPGDATWQPFRDLWPDCEPALIEFHTAHRGKPGWGYFGSSVPLPELPSRRLGYSREVRNQPFRRNAAVALKPSAAAAAVRPVVTPTTGTSVHVKTESKSGAGEVDSLTSFSQRHETVYAKPN